MNDNHSISSEDSEYDPLLTQRRNVDVDRRGGLVRRSSTNVIIKLRSLVNSSLNVPTDSVFHGWPSRFVALVLILTVLIAISIKLQFADRPSEYDDKAVTFPFRTNLSSIQDLEIWDESYTIEDSYRVETHSHSTKSDGNMTPKQLVNWAHAYGFNAIFLSDHNNINGVADARKEADKLGIVVIPSMEYTCCRIHMNLVNVTDTTSLQPVTWPSDKELKRIIEKTHDQGGYVVVNHLPWSQQTEYSYHLPTLPQHPPIEELLDWGVDSFESVHDNVIDLRMLRLVEKRGLPLIASNDIHVASQPPYVWTTLSRKSLSAGVVTADDVLREIFHKRKSTFMYSATGALERAYAPLNGGYSWYAPWTTLQFGWLFTERRGMYSFTGEFCHPRQFTVHVARAVWFVVWCIAGYVIFELCRALLILIVRRAKRRSESYRMR